MEQVLDRIHALEQELEAVRRSVGDAVPAPGREA
jgi:hypothetical protein